MKIYLGLRKTVDDNWIAEGPHLEAPDGILCQLADGSAIVIVHDGRILRFGPDGHGTWKLGPDAEISRFPSPARSPVP